MGSIKQPSADSAPQSASWRPTDPDLADRLSIRILFAFDPRRNAILLLGGDKRGRWKTWYDEMIPWADDLYDEHLAILREEGLLP